MASYRTSTPIDAPADVVWRILSDVESWPEWTDSMERLEVADGGPLREGTPVRITQPRLPKATWVVDEWRPPTVFSWTSTAPGVRSHAAHVITPVDDAHCEVLLSIEQTGPLSGLIGALTMRLTRRYIDMELAGLKARSEAEAAG